MTEQQIEDIITLAKAAVPDNSNGSKDNKDNDGNEGKIV